ncbi:PP2C family protein-serine/threonine phosphatase [Streptomyces sp. SID11385]|uniref:PP2C family protein-serine/threonine phosphatase n=1 Tax=Streptomyces sp. SID11385 TaxID=2706031 RepID=UPI0013CB1764|nr:PP2C family protein-serine/threonine phosphatase [Streptomyces sp. SID11385]NEA42041.1 serine/threonine-protein phosphatase [Streptomyces sp. SID11385]
MRFLGAGAKWVAAWRRDPVLLAPAVLTVAIGLVAVLTPPQLPFTRLLVVAPALAASLWRVRGTLLLGGVCALAVLAYAVLENDNDSMFTAGAIAAVALAAAYASHLRTQRERTLSEVEAVANTTQEVLLRPVARRVAHLEIATLYLAAAPHAKVGGDFYAAADTRFGLRLLLGDVRGKGLPAVGVAAALLGSFHEVAYEARDLGEVAERLDTSMGRYCRSRAGSGTEEFATAILVEIPHEGRHLSFLNCGHPPALLFHEGVPRSLDPRTASPPINLAEILGPTYTVERVPFGPGDTLLLYTDGVTETRAPGGAFFPLERWAGRVPAGSMPQELLRRLHRALLGQSRGNLDDDIACLAVRYGEPSIPA